MPIDWLTSTNKQRIDLYEAVTRLIKMKELTWAELYEKALKRPANSVGLAFNENFRKGKISAANAHQVYLHLVAKHPLAIPALNAAVSTAREFREFLLSNRRLGSVEILPDFVGEPIRVNSLGPEWREHPFEIEDPILFRLRLPHVYQATCALNWTYDGWFPMALDEPTDYELAVVASPADWIQGLTFIKAVTQGAQTISTSTPTKGERQRRRYENSFVFLTGNYSLLADVTSEWELDQSITDDALDLIAERFRSERLSGWCVAQINAHGIGPYK